MTSIYIAAPVPGAILCRSLATQLRGAGLDVVSTWHERTEPTDYDPITDERRRAIAQTCVEEVALAKRVVVLAHLGRTSRPPKGTFFEAGMAHALGKFVAWFHDGDAGRCIFDAVAWRRVDVSLVKGELADLVLEAVTR